tara:strand:- start:166 stop:927 length:762 start_codon:yes stop_codon:yes gene_type:complete
MKINKIYKNAKMKNPSRKRIIAENYVLTNIIVKLITPFIAYLLKKFNISPDSITIISFISLMIASCLFVFDNGHIACLFIILFGFLDSLDGDLARLNKKKSKYGATLDTMGADIFYLFIPFSVSFFLYNQNFESIFFNEEIIIIGFLISVCLIFYRLIGLRNYILFLNIKSLEKKRVNYKKKFNFLRNFFSYYDHELIRGNFFSEPGFILNFSILIFINEYQILYYYLLIIFIYTFLKILKVFFATIILYKGK